MNGWTAALLTVALGVNPAAVALTWSKQLPKYRSQAMAALGLGAVVLFLAAWLSGPLLDLLDITVPTYRLGAATVLGFAGIYWIFRTNLALDETALDETALDETALDETALDGTGEKWPSFLAVAALALVLLLPAPVLVTVAAGADGGVLAAAVGIAIAVALTLVLTSPSVPDWTLRLLSRFVGAASLALAVAMGLDAARTV